MTEKKPEARRRRRKQEIEQFLAGRDWNDVFHIWKDTLDNLSITLQPLFTEVWAHDPKYPVYHENAFSWWPAESIQELQLSLQRHLDHFPGSVGPLHRKEYYTRKGELDTLDYLWKNREKAEKIAAILISASLFYRLKSSRRDYPRGHWPPISCVEMVFHLALSQWFEGEWGLPWHHACTRVLPDIRSDKDCKIDDLQAFIHYLAEEHATVLSGFKPVAITFKPQRDPRIEQQLLEEYELERKNRDLSRN